MAKAFLQVNLTLALARELAVIGCTTARRLPPAAPPVPNPTGPMLSLRQGVTRRAPVV